MRNIRFASGAVLALALAGCGWRRTPVPIVSESGSISALVGSWSGDYKSNDTGRSGSITFQLASAKDTAYGDVVMMPRPRAIQAVGMEGHQGAAVTPANPSEPLTIRFVKMEDGRVTGSMVAYADPECGCRVLTSFIGSFTDDSTIEGTFTTRGVDPAHQPASGQWKVTRQRSRTTSPED